METLVSPCLEADEQLVGRGRSRDQGIFTLDVGGEAQEEELEGDMEQRADRVETTSDSGQPSKRGCHDHEAAHAKHRKLVCGICVRGRGMAMKHPRSAVERNDEDRVHTLVMEYCSPQGITVLVIKETNIKAISARSWFQKKGANEHLVRQGNCFADFMSRCGCGRARRASNRRS